MNKNIPFFKMPFFPVVCIPILLAGLGVTIHTRFGQSWVDTSGWAIGSDDAYIGYRYAENLFNGQGLVFNPGEWVEGYSNLLYIILTTPVFLWSRDIVYYYSVALNFFFYALAIYSFYALLDKKAGQSKALLGAFLLALSPFMWANTATGLETTLFIFAIVLFWYALEGVESASENKQHSLELLTTALLVTLVRVDGFIVPLIGIAYLILKGREKIAAQLMFFVLLVAVFYTATRMYFYDEIISNTYYAKVSGGIADRLETGMWYVVSNLMRTGLWVAVLAAIVPFFKKSMNRNDLLGRVNFPVFFLAAWLAYMIAIGGDLNYERFLIAALPPGIYIVVVSLPPVSNWLAWTGVLLLGVAIQSIAAFSDGRFDYRAVRYDAWITLGRHLGERHNGAVLAVDAAGKVPYYSRLMTIDILGLMDKHIAKKTIGAKFAYGLNKSDPHYVLSRRPDLIAAWVDPRLNLAWGFKRSLYVPDYAFKYLVNISRENLGDANIIDVSNRSVSEIKQLVSRKHRYAVLVRKDEPSH